MERLKIEERTFCMQSSSNFIAWATKELLKYNSSTNYTDVLTSKNNLPTALNSDIGDKLQNLLRRNS